MLDSRTSPDHLKDQAGDLLRCLGPGEALHGGRHLCAPLRVADEVQECFGQSTGKLAGLPAILENNGPAGR